MLKSLLLALIVLLWTVVTLEALQWINWKLVFLTLRYWIALLVYTLKRPLFAMRIWYWTRQARLAREKLQRLTHVRIVEREPLESEPVVSSPPSGTVE